MGTAPESRKMIRDKIRLRRQSLNESFQKQAALNIVEQLKSHPKFVSGQHIALYLANDGELNLQEVIQWCWRNNKNVYLPIIHPFSSKHLLFIRYHKDSKMLPNRFNILEPQLNQVEIMPVEKLHIICTPLVAFDKSGARLGMGGGFYDRTLAPLLGKQNSCHPTTPYFIGLAHDCQQVEVIQAEDWDIPMPEIITPSQNIVCRMHR